MTLLNSEDWCFEHGKSKKSCSCASDEPRAVRCERCDQFQCACPDVITVPQGMGPILAAVLAEVADIQKSEEYAMMQHTDPLKVQIRRSALALVRALRLSKESK